MTLTTSGTCQAFVTDLWNSNLINHTELKVCNEFLQGHSDAQPSQLANFLVQRSILTRFQADEVLRGRASELTVWTYVLLDIIGRGSMGTVYKAVSRTEKHLVAIKMLPRRSVANIPKTSRVLKAFREFRHPAVVPIVHVGTAAERHYMVWPYVPGGETLESIVQRQGKLSPKEVVYYGLQMSKALHVCHQHDLFHGLLKPSDFLIDANHRLTILDFGIGFLLTLGRQESMLDTMTNTNYITRALDYAAPESIIDSTVRTPASDQYSLGCVLYHCLTGRPPFPTVSEVKKMVAHQHEEPRPIHELNAQIPPPLGAIVMRMMRKRPEQRFESMEEVTLSLKALLSPSAQGTKTPSAQGTTPITKAAVPPATTEGQPMPGPQRARVPSRPTSAVVGPAHPPWYPPILYATMVILLAIFVWLVFR